MDSYTKYARVYPSIVGMMLPAIMTTLFMAGLLAQIEAIAINVISYLGLFASSGIVYSAIGYTMSELFRSTSKMIFQSSLYHSDETKIPTTELLLWKNRKLSKDYHKRIAGKIKEEFKIKLMNEEEEQQDEFEARLRIVNAVQLIREKTRDNAILKQYNYEFGFCRNYMGAAIWSILILSIFEIVNFVVLYINWRIGATLILLQVLFIVLAFFILRNKADAYASQLLSSYMFK